MSDELDYELTPADDGKHDCPSPGRARLDFDVFACGKHWRMIPWALKGAISRAWNRGDIQAHVDARKACVDWLEAHTQGEL